jgi:hypothetical protein
MGVFRFQIWKMAYLSIWLKKIFYVSCCEADRCVIPGAITQNTNAIWNNIQMDLRDKF